VLWITSGRCISSYPCYLQKSSLAPHFDSFTMAALNAYRQISWWYSETTKVLAGPDDDLMEPPYRSLSMETVITESCSCFWTFNISTASFLHNLESISACSSYSHLVNIPTISIDGVSFSAWRCMNDNCVSMSWTKNRHTLLHPALFSQHHVRYPRIVTLSHRSKTTFHVPNILWDSCSSTRFP